MTAFFQDEGAASTVRRRGRREPTTIAIFTVVWTFPEPPAMGDSMTTKASSGTTS
jgi:hypothetical protein